MAKKKTGTRPSFDAECLPIKEKEELTLTQFEFSQDEIPILSISFVDNPQYLTDVVYFLQFVTKKLEAKLCPCPEGEIKVTEHFPSSSSIDDPSSSI